MNAPGAIRVEQFDAREALRAATEDTHVGLHGLPHFVAIEEARLDLAHYTQLLARLHRFHSAIAALAHMDGKAQLSSSPRRCALLEADLAALRQPVPPAEFSAARASGLYLLGMLYVAEGSALGGRVIHRQLDYLFEAAEGRTFFAGDALTARHWRFFLDHLRASCTDPSDLPELVAGAEAGFALFRKCAG